MRMNVRRGSCDLHTGWLRTVRAEKDIKLGGARDGKNWEGH